MLKTLLNYLQIKYQHISKPNEKYITLILKVLFVNFFGATILTLSVWDLIELESQTKLGKPRPIKGAARQLNEPHKQRSK